MGASVCPVDDPLDAIRQRLADIDAELRSSPDIEWSHRVALRDEASKLRVALREAAAGDLEAAKAAWANRAGRKGAHEVDYDATQKVLGTFHPPPEG